MVDVDWMVDFKKSVNAFRGKCNACGNFDPIEVLLRGSVDEVLNAVNKCMDEGDDTTFIAAGCEVPRNTPYENLLAVSEALKNYT